VDGVIRGSLSNVLSRYVQLAQEVPCDYIIRVTADNPLTEYGFIKPLLTHAFLHDLPYALVKPSLCPEGTNLEIISKQALFDSAASERSDANREHVTSFMRNNPSCDHSLTEAALHYFPFACRQLSFTVDTLSDYVQLVKLLNRVGQDLGVSWQSPQFVHACAEIAFSDPCSYAKGRNHLIQ